MLGDISNHKLGNSRSGRLRRLRHYWERDGAPSQEDSWASSFKVWVSLNALDALVTGLCLSLGMSEANPFLKVAVVTHGPGPMLAVKMVLALLIGVLVWKRGPRQMKSALNMGMALILIANCALVCRPLWSMNT